MDNKLLKKFYNINYKHKNENLTELKYKNYPHDRTETVYKYFIDNFKTGRILEIGTGGGTLAYSLLKNIPGITEYTGIEISSPRVEFLRANLTDPRFKVIEGNAEYLDLDLGKFDAIIMIAVIEHLIDPLGFMKKLKEKLLADNAFVYINTPNIADYGARRKLLFGKFPSTATKDEGLTTYDNKPVQMYDQGHLHYFTFSSLENMLRRYCGYSKFERVPQPVGPKIISSKFHYKLAKWKPTLFSEINVVAS